MAKYNNDKQSRLNHIWSKIWIFQVDETFKAWGRSIFSLKLRSYALWLFLICSFIDSLSKSRNSLTINGSLYSNRYNKWFQKFSIDFSLFFLSDQDHFLFYVSRAFIYWDMAIGVEQIAVEARSSRLNLEKLAIVELSGILETSLTFDKMAWGLWRWLEPERRWLSSGFLNSELIYCPEEDGSDKLEMTRALVETSWPISPKIHSSRND